MDRKTPVAAEPCVEERWTYAETRVYIGNLGGFDLRDVPHSEETARRITAAMNYTRHVPVEILESESALTWAEKTAELEALVADLRSGVREATSQIEALCRASNVPFPESSMARYKALTGAN